MNEKNPICLGIAVSYPAIVVAYVLFCFVFLPHSAYPNGPNEGGLPANFGTGLILAAIFGVLYLIGFAFLIASLVRKEKYRLWAFMCLAIYLVPVAAIALPAHRP